MKRIFDIIYKANPRRSLDNLCRRMLKIGEEGGEANEAYLNVTSELNHKGSTWEDVREELLDVIIIAVDCLYTPMPILVLFISSLSFLFLLDYLFLENIIHWGFEVAWGLSILLYSIFFLKWSANPTDWLPFILGHRIWLDYEAAENAIILDKEITKWVKENVSPLMYAKENFNSYYFLRKSDYIAFKLRWT